METIRKALKREFYLKILASLVLLVSGILLFVYAFQLNAVVVVFGLILTVLGIKFTHKTLLEANVENAPLIQLLVKNPKKIVWVYSIVTQRMPFGLEFSRNATVYFKLNDGDELTLSLSEKESERVLKMLNLMLPHATFGYTRDREQWFMANPELLYRS